MAPLLPELREALLDLFELAEPGSEYAVERHRHLTQSDLGTQFRRIIEAAKRS